MADRKSFHADDQERQNAFQSIWAAEREVFVRFGFPEDFIKQLIMNASLSACTLEDVLLAGGHITEDVYFAALAEELGLPFQAEIDPALIRDASNIDLQLKMPFALMCHPEDAIPYIAIVPSAYRLGEEKARISMNETVTQRIVVTTRRAVRDAVWAVGAERRLQTATSELFERDHNSSARIALKGRQGFAAGCIVVGLVSWLLAYTDTALFVLHFLISALFLLGLLFRGLALRLGKPHCLDRQTLMRNDHWPVYTVLVALYREGEMIPQLIERLSSMNWPATKLDIKLVCEAGDIDTLQALEEARLGPQFEIVRVPEGGPKTKPKALNYALAGARGEFTVIYDAEDRPHPDQLIEACQRFCTGRRELGCLQAPLVISNGRTSLIASLFALEYAAHFRRMLPFLARLNLPLPLGGTSNHFRTEVLREVGAWDPYNVTEDADLGLRLARHGYFSETLHRATIEDAPTERNVWTRQRSRWLKGWMQTWLVHMRSPFALVRQIGLLGVLSFHTLTTAMLISAIWHPMFYIFLVGFYFTGSFEFETRLGQALLGIDVCNMLMSFMIFVRLGNSAMGENERSFISTCWYFLPVYWLMLTWAALRAAWQLVSNPHHWEKTPHKPVSRRRIIQECD